MKSEKPRISMKVLYLLLIWFIIIGVGTYVAANPQVKSAQTDKKRYSLGERISIVGQASEADSLRAELVMPDGSKVLLVPRLEKDFFSLNFTTSLEGIYNLSLVANALVFGFVPKSSSSFTLSIPVFDNPSISLNYSKVAKTGSQVPISILARDTSQVARVLVEYDGMNSTIPVLAEPSIITSPYPIKTMMVKLTGIKMVFSRDISESQRNDFELELLLPVAISGHGMAVSVSWITSRECYLVSPDPSSGSVWLPSKDIGQINFQAWFQGIKVLDTGISSITPAGAKPLSLAKDDYDT